MTKSVFVHLPKNAGQSIEQVFLDLHGLDWEKREVLLMRHNTDPEKGPPRLAHLQARQYVDCGHMTPQQWNDYFSFTFVRNPWQRVVSFYKYFTFDQRCDFNYFVEAIFAPAMFKHIRWFVGPQTDFLCDKKGWVMVDFVGRYENLQQDFDKISQQLGLSIRPLPWLNKSGSERGQFMAQELVYVVQQVCQALGLVNQRVQPVFDKYQDYYNGVTRDRIATLYARDIGLFNYSFELSQGDKPCSPPWNRLLAYTFHV